MSGDQQPIAVTCTGCEIKKKLSTHHFATSYEVSYTVSSKILVANEHYIKLKHRFTNDSQGPDFI